jgi:tetratricopeptide (TPR) repeat protein
MLTPSPVLAKKNRIITHAVVVFAMAVMVVGCAPPGPRALLKGRKLLDRGDYDGAVAQLKAATAILSTNAEAWNYYGVALQHTGQLADASTAYQNAIRFDRDLVEAHYNLGYLYLEQDKLSDAKTEFTAYILRRSNAPEGWVRLGDVQLRSDEPLLAERSFSTVLSLSQDNADALNGLGLARVQRGKPHDAAEFFAAAVQHHPDFAPAILNLATVEAEYLRDNQAALDDYRKYLALSPRPPDWDAVNVLVQNMEQMPAAVATPPSPSPAPVAGENQEPPAQESRPAFAGSEVPEEHVYSSPRPQQTPHYISNPPPETVRVEPEQGMVTAQQPVTSTETAPTTSSRGVWHRLNPVHWFGSSNQENYENSGVTPLPSENENNVTAAQAPPKPKLIPPAPPTFPRYLYLSPRKPRPGDRKAAAAAFVQAQDAQQKHDWQQAVDSYQNAARLDPSWFEAQYNYGVLAYDLGDFSRALAADEMALAIQPDSVGARYNFALALKSAGYMTDAEIELKKVVALDPNNVRAHLALGNLYAQQLQNPALARAEYLKVLALDPYNPRATDIQFWLSANPQ